MFGYPEAPMAWWLTRGMARISGVDLPEAVVEGWLKREELAELVARCAACVKDEVCASWLAQSGPARAMPGFCPNKREIESLAG